MVRKPDKNTQTSAPATGASARGVSLRKLSWGLAWYAVNAGGLAALYFSNVLG